MSELEKSKSLKYRLKRFFAAIQISEIKSSTKELICAWIQVVGSTGLATYMYEKGIRGILPIILSSIAVGGTFNYLKILRRNSSYTKSSNWSLSNFAIGIVTYSTGVYALSQFLKRNDEIWILCLVLAASGFYFTTLSIKRLDTVVNKRPFLKCCQLMSEPALVACAATYLLYLRNHTEEWLKCLPFLVTAATGVGLADRGRFRNSIANHSILLKAIEMCMGGCFLCTSCTALAIYGYTNDFYRTWTAFMSFWSVYGAFVTFDSLTWFQRYVEMEESVFDCIFGMIIGPNVILLACLSLKCISHPLNLPLYFGISGTGIALLVDSFMELHDLVPEPAIQKYYEHVIGPLVTVNSLLFAAYFGYHIGWCFSLVTVPFMAYGISTTCRGFGRRNDSQ